MSYQALARKWRPQTFSDVIGQETIVRTLQNAIEQNRVHHAYLFSGVRGVGKTTAARIFAKALNCAKGPTTEPCNECTICREITEGIDLDVREIDAATYTQVDNIRDLREMTQFQPARDRQRIFIIDEAHMLSAGAWNALLKLIEEPPPHVAFIMATTEMQKVPATILSRVQRFVFRKITQPVLVQRLTEICAREALDVDPAALEMIARRGEGSVRDALSILDQIIAFSGKQVGTTEVITVLGLSDAWFFARIAEAIAAGDHGTLLEALEEAGESGRDFKLLHRDFLSFLRSLLLVSAGASESVLSLPPDELALLRQAAENFSYTDVLRVLNLLIRDDDVISKAEHQRLAVEISLLKAATLPRLRSVQQILQGLPVPEAMSGTVNAVAPARLAAPVAEAPAKPRTAKQSQPSPDPGPQEESGASPESNTSTAGFMERVRQQRKGMATYLDQASTVSLDSDQLLFTFDSANKFAAEFLSESDQMRFLTETAAALYGRPISVRIAATAAGAESGPAASPAASDLNEDPVLKAFARHLGGEVQKRKPTRSSRE
ncbi:MAG: DNA polymerase III subunit gamma/tau [Acidobacteriota bacterium]